MEETTNNVMPQKSGNYMLKTLIVIVVAILAILVIVNNKNQKQIRELDKAIEQKQMMLKSQDPVVQKIETQSNSDSVVDINKDLKATNVNDLDF